MWAVTQPGLVLSQLLQQAVHRSCLFAGSRVRRGGANNGIECFRSTCC